MKAAKMREADRETHRGDSDNAPSTQNTAVWNGTRS
jgi:hypothetical protein